MDNYQIADNFSLLSKLMDIHGENSFKAKSYASAAFNIERLPVQLSEIAKEKIGSLKGIGDSIAKKIIEILETGELQSLKDIITKTPEGIIELLNIKGIGPKKIATIWKEMEIESVGELLYACKENRLKLYKGFGEKTQQNIIDTIEYYLKNKENFLFSQVDATIEQVLSFFKKIFFDTDLAITGEFNRKSEIIHELEFVVNDSLNAIENKFLPVEDFELIEKNEDNIVYKISAGIKIRIFSCGVEPFCKQTFIRNCSSDFWNYFKENFSFVDYSTCKTDEDIFLQAKINYIDPCRREGPQIIEKAKLNILTPIISVKDIKGIIHSHSNWSDGSNTIEEMANHAIKNGFEYLVISDHSKSAFYAQGLSEERIKEQHRYIDELNTKFSPFKIFKSIESDILNDGSLDYSDAVLSTFDLVIASVHSNLKMSEEKAMQRLIKAIENPFTSILGHLTGRLLLSRKGYPVDHKKIIDACAANNVVIELNANPHRLDIDWRYIDYALEKNVLISIDPDAHVLEGFDDIRFGVSVAQKTLLTKMQNVSSFDLKTFEAFLIEQAKKR